MKQLLARGMSRAIKEKPREAAKLEIPQMETPQWDPISETAKDLIQRMLTTDVNHRITIQEVLNHKWLRVSTRQQQRRHTNTPPNEITAPPVYMRTEPCST